MVGGAERRQPFLGFAPIQGLAVLRAANPWVSL